MPFNFNVGDIVKAHDGRVGQVVHVFDKHQMATVEIPPYGVELYAFRSLVLVGPKSDDELANARVALQKTRQRVSDLARENETLRKQVDALSKSVQWWQSRVTEAAKKVDFMGGQINKMRNERPCTPEELSRLRFKNNQLQQQKRRWKKIALEAQKNGLKRRAKVADEDRLKVYKSINGGLARWITYMGVTYFGRSQTLPKGVEPRTWVRAGAQEPDNDPTLRPVHDEKYIITDKFGDTIRAFRLDR